MDFYPDTDYCETIFEDGTRCPASPQDNGSYRATAKLLGYGENLMQMCLDHEVLHTLLAQVCEQPYSKTLWAVAHGETFAGAAAEEELVMEFQRKFRTASSMCRRTA